MGCCLLAGTKSSTLLHMWGEACLSPSLRDLFYATSLQFRRADLSHAFRPYQCMTPSSQRIQCFLPLPMFCYHVREPCNLLHEGKDGARDAIFRQ